MEWVEVAAKTVEEATESALDQLGVAVGDAEVIVLAEPKAGLFGRTRGEARVRARVRPVGPRPKRERRPRDRDRGGNRNQGSGNAQRQGAPKPDGRAAADGERVDLGRRVGRADRDRHQPIGAPTSEPQPSRRRGLWNGSGGERPEPVDHRSSRPAEKNQQRSTEPKETVAMAEGMTLEEQGEVGRAFLAGLLSEYGMQATVETRLIDEETVEIAARGDELGLLVGPRGSTLSALQDITRAVVQRQCPSRTDRILVDVAGYREKRSAALKRFSTQIAEEVIASGQEKALESMSPADRKAVHDAVNEIDGVATRSEGEDPNRYIVIAPTG